MTRIITVSFPDGLARLVDGAWQADSPDLLSALQDRQAIAIPRGDYRPDWDLAIAQDAARRFGGAILSDNRPPDRPPGPGVVY